MPAEPRSYLSDARKFGRSGAQWVVTLQDDPAEVAAAYLQHRLVLQLGSSHELDASTAGQLMGTSDRRTTERRVRGQQAIPLVELVRSALSGLDDPAGIIPDEPTEWFPAEARHLLSAWGPGLPLVFTEPDTLLATVVARVTAYVAAEEREARLTVLSAEAVVREVLRGLRQNGITDSRIRIDEDVRGVTVWGRHRLDIDVLVHVRDGPAALWELFKVMLAERSRDALLVMSSRPASLLRSYMPGEPLGGPVPLEAFASLAADVGGDEPIIETPEFAVVLIPGALPDGAAALWISSAAAT